MSWRHEGREGWWRRGEGREERKEKKQWKGVEKIRAKRRKEGGRKGSTCVCTCFLSSFEESLSGT